MSDAPEFADFTLTMANGSHWVVRVARDVAKDFLNVDHLTADELAEFVDLNVVALSAKAVPKIERSGLYEGRVHLRPTDFV